MNTLMFDSGAPTEFISPALRMRDARRVRNVLICADRVNQRLVLCVAMPGGQIIDLSISSDGQSFDVMLTDR